jgi:hypothetical protein
MFGKKKDDTQKIKLKEFDGFYNERGVFTFTTSEYDTDHYRNGFANYMVVSNDSNETDPVYSYTLYMNDDSGNTYKFILFTPFNDLKAFLFGFHVDSLELIRGMNFEVNYFKNVEGNFICLDSLKPIIDDIATIEGSVIGFSKYLKDNDEREWYDIKVIPSDMSKRIEGFRCLFDNCTFYTISVPVNKLSGYTPTIGSVLQVQVCKNMESPFYCELDPEEGIKLYIQSVNCDFDYIYINAFEGTYYDNKAYNIKIVRSDFYNNVLLGIKEILVFPALHEVSINGTSFKAEITATE